MLPFFYKFWTFILLPLILTDTVSTWICIFCLLFSHAIVMSLLPSKFYITSTSCSFMKLNLSISNFCAAHLHTNSLFLTFSTTSYLSVLQSAALKERLSSILECSLLSINMWLIWILVFPSREVQVYSYFDTGTLCSQQLDMLVWQSLLM
jgi:hypothetical protein